MAILGIVNRTENCKTAYYFAPLFRNDASRLALARKLREPEETIPDDIHIELYWHGMRDYLLQIKRPKESNKQYFPRLAAGYGCLFPSLREKIKEFESEGLRLRLPNSWNYDVSDEDSMNSLGTNLVGTEVDVVLESSRHLFIGEAKEEMNLDGNGSRILVHQLVRQYVTAKLLLKLVGVKKTVVPFLVRENLKGREQVQVEFMVDQGWLKREHILTWDQMAHLHLES